MDNYTKKVKVSFEADERSLNDIDDTLEELGKRKLVDDESIKSLRLEISKYKEEQSTLKKLQTNLNEISKLNVEGAKEAREQLEQLISLQEKRVRSFEVKDIIPDITNKDLFKEGFEEIKSDVFDKVFDFKEMGSKFATALFGGAAATAFLKALKDLFKNATEELKSMASYSLLSNDETRRLAFTYGLTGGQGYGFNKALEMTGLTEESMFYADPLEREKFQQYFIEYSQKYNDLFDSGFFTEYREFEFARKEFDEELRMTVMKFIVDNKDVITEGMKAMVWSFDILSKIATFILGNYANVGKSSSQRYSSAADIINNYSTVGRTTNVKIDNTFNNVNKENQTWLANAGQMTYKQIIEALK